MAQPRRSIGSLSRQVRRHRGDLRPKFPCGNPQCLGRGVGDLRITLRWTSQEYTDLLKHTQIKGIEYANGLLTTDHAGVISTYFM